MDEFTNALGATVRRANEFHRHLVAQFLPDRFAVRLDWDSNVRPAIGYTFLQIGLQHLGGLLILAEHEAVVPCLALFRPMIEAHIRALWFFGCASDGHIKELSSARTKFRFPKFREMVDAISAKKPGVSKHLLGGEDWKALCDYTHGGLGLIERSVMYEANSDKAKLLMVGALRKGTKAVGVSIFMFTQDSPDRAMAKFIKTLLREYLSDEEEHKKLLGSLGRQLKDEDLRQHFESEVKWYGERGDKRRRESYKENPYDS
jgi:hypothetical protein